MGALKGGWGRKGGGAGSCEWGEGGNQEKKEEMKIEESSGVRKNLFAESTNKQ